MAALLVPWAALAYIARRPAGALSLAGSPSHRRARTVTRNWPALAALFVAMGSDGRRFGMGPSRQFV